VLEVLLWSFHNARSGLCFPSYETMAARAGCARSTVAEAIKALEAAGILSWVNRITRIRDRVPDMFGQWASRWRVIRTSNAYHFRDPKPSKSEIPPGTPNQEKQDSLCGWNRLSPPPSSSDSPLERSIGRFWQSLLPSGTEQESSK
jgi:DNA-binding transcriptional MocR family regulator